MGQNQFSCLVDIWCLSESNLGLLGIACWKVKVAVAWYAILFFDDTFIAFHPFHSFSNTS
jgi:hypothetical protein